MPDQPRYFVLPKGNLWSICTNRPKKGDDRVFRLYTCPNEDLARIGAEALNVLDVIQVVVRPTRMP
jgi:hypothetical protein